VYNTSLHNSR